MSDVLEYEITSSWTRKLALLNLLADGIESVIADYGCKEVRANLNETLEICYSQCEDTPQVSFELEDIIQHGLADTIRMEECREGIDPSEIYREAARLLIKRSVSSLMDYALKTKLTNIEYMLIVLQNGRGLILQGGRNRVSIPLIKSAASIHTHPAGCVPSPHDVRSWINLFFDGGMGAGIVSTDCQFFIVREGLFTENDLLSLSRLRSSLSSRNIPEIRKMLGNRIIGDSLRVYVL